MNNEQIQEIFVEDIIPNRFQPRLTFDEKALQELSDSIKVHGVIQPLVLRKVGNKYEIIAGERRYKASCMAGLKKVPAVVREMTDDESAEVALIENVQRKNLTSIEEAQSYKNLLDRGYLTQEDLAKKLGVSQPTIANKLRLLNLCDEVQDALLNEKISERHARSLLQVSDPDMQKKMLNRVIKERLTVKQLDNEIKKLLDGNTSVSSDNGGGNTQMVSNNGEVESTKNIFGLNVEKTTDLESTPANMDLVENDIPPASFNPFAANPSPQIQPAGSEEPIETFDMFGDVFTPAPATNVNPVNSERNVGDQINSIRETIKSVENSGFRVEMEEYDFEDVYQIIIKIQK